MLSTIIQVLVASIPKSFMEQAFKALAMYSIRKSIKEAIADLVSDEIDIALRDHDIGYKDRQRYLEKKDRKIKNEVRVRFNPILRQMK